MNATDALTLTDGLSPLVAEAIDPYRALDTDERRLWRARFEEMAIVPRVNREGECGGLYDVLRPDYDEDAREPDCTRYTVDLVERRCDCPFDRERDVPCKHALRVVLALDETPLPEPGALVGGYWGWLDGQMDAIAGTPHFDALRKEAVDLAQSTPAYGPEVA